MRIQSQNGVDQEEQLQAALAEYLQAVEAGGTPDRDAFLARHPHLADELASFFENHDRFAQRAELLGPIAPCSRRSTNASEQTDFPPTDGETVGSSSTRLVVQRSVGDYELLEEIGRGGMGVVYKAQQKSLNRTVAVKMLLGGAFAGPNERVRFRNEAEAAANLDHPNIVPIYEVGEHEEQLYFSMKLIDGGSLARRLPEFSLACARSKSDRSKRQSAIASLMISVARAVHHAHRHSLLHRDLKPGNILLNGADEPHVTDFGLAKRVENRVSEQSATIAGTANYMAPEQAEGQPLTTSADVYGLGAILYELLTGQPPFRANTAIATLLERRHADPQRPTSLNPSIDRDLETICQKCLAKEPSHRYSSAEAFAEDLERWNNGLPIQARPVGKVIRLWRGCRRNPLVAGLASAVLLVAMLGFLGVLGQWQVALANEQKAKEHAAQAKKERDEVTGLNEKLNAANDNLRATQEQLRRTLYAAHINLAQHAWEASNVERVLELLGQHRAKPGETDLRGFEWYYLYRLSHSELLTLKGHTRPVHFVAFSPDGKRLASAGGTIGNPGELKVWDAQTGEETLNLKGHSDYVDEVVFSPDGQRLASGSNDKTVKVWNAQTGEELLTFKGHTGYVRGVAFSPDGKRLASSGGMFGDPGMGEVKVWDSQTGQELLTFKGHAAIVSTVCFSPDGKRLASGSPWDTVKVWDSQTGQEFLTLKGHLFQGRAAGARSVAFSPDGKRLATGAVDNTVKVWDAQTGEEKLTLKAHTGWTYVAFSPDGKRLASAGGTLARVWDARTGQETLTLKGHSRDVTSVAFSPDGKQLASGSWDKTIKLWDAHTDPKTPALKTEHPIRSVDFSPDLQRIASVSSHNAVKVWDAATGQEMLTLKGHTARVGSVSFSPNGQRIVGTGGGVDPKTGKYYGEVKVWDAATGQETLTLKGHTGYVSSVAFSPDRQRIVSSGGGMDPKTRKFFGEVKVWDAATGQETLTLKGHTGYVSSVAFSPDGQRIVGSGGGVDPKTGKHYGDVKVWDAATGQETLTLKGHTGYVSSVAFSPDGKRLAGVGGNQLKVWDVQTGREAVTLKGHSGVSSVAFSADGKRLASGSWDDETVKVWDVSTGQELFALTGHTQGVFSPDGKRIVCTGRELKVWDVTTGQELLTLQGHSGSVSSVAFGPDGHRLASAGGETVRIWDATPLPEKRQPNPR